MPAAEDQTPEPSPPQDPAEPEVAEDFGPPPHGARFHVFTGASIAIAVAVVFVLGGLLLAGRGDRRTDRGPGWSAWEPTKDGAAGAEQIATRVGRTYRAPDGRRLVLVQGGAFELAGLPLTVALRQSAAAGGGIELIQDKGVLYRLCGLGRDCAIDAGEPSIERHLLLRREALELALYSLRYLDGVEQVAVIMPPRPGDRPGQALFFRRNQVSDELAKPLDATLVNRTPSVARVTKSPDALLVEHLTIPTLFRFSLTQGNQDGRALLMLDPFDSAPAQPAPSERTGSGGESGRSNASILRVNPGQSATGTRGYLG